MATFTENMINDLPELARTLVVSAQTKSDLSIAGSMLAKHRHESKTQPQKVYTGRVFGRRARRGMLVVLPCGRLIGRLVLAWRGVAAVVYRDEFAVRPDQVGYFRTDELRPFKNPAAALLGSRKRGVKEKTSSAKQSAARRNGRLPVRPGSRPRGRPRKRTVSPGALE